LPRQGSISPTTARLVPLEGAVQEILFVVEEPEDGSYRASAAAAAIHTEADTLVELHGEIREAVVCHFDPGQAPPLIRLHHVRQELLAL
jgi:streptomycin 6-kinase